MTSLKSLSIQQIKSIKGLLERYFFTEGMNIALVRALKTKTAETFKNRVEKALRSQLLKIAELDKIAPLIDEVQKADKIKTFVEDEWVPFEDAIPGGKLGILAFLAFAADVGGQAGLDKMVPQHNFQLRNKSLIKALDKRAEFLMDTVDKTGMTWTIKVIDSLAKQGLTATEIVKILRKEIPEIAQIRSELITETEMMYTMNKIEMETYKRNGIRYTIWKTSEDERVCMSVCVPNEMAGPVPLGEEFPSGQDKPPGHERCRCLLLPVLPNYIEGEVWTGE